MHYRSRKSDADNILDRYQYLGIEMLSYNDILIARERSTTKERFKLHFEDAFKAVSDYRAS